MSSANCSESDRDPEPPTLSTGKSSPSSTTSNDIVDRVDTAWSAGHFGDELAMTYPEPDQAYYPGGHLAVHFGELLGARAEYRVVHKLGVGSFGIVWLCQVTDSEPVRYVAVKVLTAKSLRIDQEVKTLQLLSRIAKDDPDIWKYILRPLEVSQLEGPDGMIHDVLVYPVGAPVCDALFKGVKDPEGHWRSLTRQAAEAMAVCHRHGICHGDFRPQNILYRIDTFDGVPVETIYNFLTPVARAIRHKFDDPKACHPDYIVYPIETPNKFTEDQTTANPCAINLCLIDWGESFEMTNPPEQGTGIPLDYASPELVLNKKCSAASDIWALACTMVEIRMGFTIYSFWGAGTEATYVASVVNLLGIPPEPLWSQIPDRWKEKCTDSTGAVLANLSGLQGLDRVKQTIHKTAAAAGRRNMCHTEAELFGDLIGKMLTWTPEERLTIGQVVQHPWFLYTDDVAASDTTVAGFSDSPHPDVEHADVGGSMGGDSPNSDERNSTVVEPASLELGLSRCRISS
ncbi:kinase-like domain-containing protein [Aspergillus crustosus]